MDAASTDLLKSRANARIVLETMGGRRSDDVRVPSPVITIGVLFKDADAIEVLRKADPWWAG